MAVTVKPQPTGVSPKRGKSASRDPSSCICHNEADPSAAAVGRKTPAHTLAEVDHRESTFILQKKQNEKRYEKNYKNWHLAKAELKEESSRVLRQRINLQHTLIQKQDELATERRKILAEDAARKREAEKEKRQETVASYQKICRQSLDEDKKKQTQEAKTTTTTAATTPQHGASGPSSLPSFPSKTGGVYKKPMMRKHGVMTARPRLVVGGPQPSMVAEEEGEQAGGEEDDDVETVQGGASPQEQLEEENNEEEPLPWHAEQLYKLYGPQADYFLKPKLEDKERKKAVTVINPKQMRQRGRAGAGPLWTSLRNESQGKLLQQDMQISPDLKAAYSAFVRQCLSKRKKPVKRNFSAQEDARPPGVRTMEDLWREQVPEMDRLLDQSKVLAAHDYKHMVEVMYRASVTNHDKTGILRHNNPPPNLNNWQGEESCARYMPSWIPTYDEEDDSAVHAKWLSKKNYVEEEATTAQAWSHEARSEQGQGDGAELPRQMAALSVSSNSNDEWEFLKNIRKKRVQPKTPRYIFLTEEAATCPGEFSKQRKEKLDSRNIPKAYDKGQVKAQSALAMVDDNSSRRSLSARSMPRTDSEASQRMATGWQPLSLNALIEYKEKIAVVGGGDFNHGSAPRWNVEKAY